MNQVEKITGVILAGGLARRMQNRDKGLVLYHDQPLISYAISALLPVVDRLLINANRSLAEYQQFGYKVIADQTDSYDGPLAGILAAMIQAKTELLVVMPCDSPLFETQHVARLVQALEENQAQAAVASDGARLHPVFLALRTELCENLQAYLASGQRKLAVWLADQAMVTVDFSDEPEVFSNINSLVELAALEKQTAKESNQ